uniref:GMP reductase n=1 Tax=Panagrolaimus sp. ES5 TaxID=591445 RepID=A0AC34FP81_9BILA
MPRIEMDKKLDFADVMLRPKRSTLKSRSEVVVTRDYDFLHSKGHYEGIPIVASNMDTVGTFDMAKTLAGHTLFTTIHKHYSVDEWEKFADSVERDPKILDHIAISAGTSESDFAKLVQIILDHIAISAGTSESDFAKLVQIVDKIPELKYICLDVANGYSEHFVHFIHRVREQFDKHTIFAGNVVTCEMVEELILAGADVVKVGIGPGSVGIGPGSVCTTRKKAGVGYPQLSAVLECADAAHGLKGHVMSDGGCTNPGDVAKAFGAGADFVMLGGMFAGHDQSGGEVIEKNGKQYKLFYGMSSDTAMKKHHGAVAEYRASEGKTIQIPYRGDVNKTILDILGGLRSACTYTGAAKLKELPKRTTFICVARQTNEVYTHFEV